MKNERRKKKLIEMKEQNKKYAHIMTWNHIKNYLFAICRFISDVGWKKSNDRKRKEELHTQLTERSLQIDESREFGYCFHM